jgi:hypothetical protein
MAQQDIKNTEEIFPEMPEAPKITIPKLPDLISSCGCPLKKAALILGLVVLALLVIFGAHNIISYITYGELVHIPFGNQGQGFHWPTNNHGVLETFRAYF